MYVLFMLEVQWYIHVTRTLTNRISSPETISKDFNDTNFEILTRKCWSRDTAKSQTGH